MVQDHICNVRVIVDCQNESPDHSTLGENQIQRSEQLEKSTYLEYIVYDYQTISSKRIKYPAQVSDSIWFYGEKERSTWLGNDDQTCTSEVITESSSEFGLGPRLSEMKINHEMIRYCE